MSIYKLFTNRDEYSAHDLFIATKKQIILMKIKNTIYLLFTACIIFTACKKEHYQDSGVHNGVFSGTIYEYLETKPEYFDTLLQVIDAAEMKDLLNNKDKEITFFAPPNLSIIKAVRSLNRQLNSTGKDTVVQLTQIKKEVWRELLSLYVFDGKYMLKDFAQLDTLDLNAFGGQSFDSYTFDQNEGRPMNIGVVYRDVSGVKYAGYRQLHFSYIGDLSNQLGSLINIPVASSNIEPSKAALHVLQYRSHLFGFTSANFISLATTAGINPSTAGL